MVDGYVGIDKLNDLILLKVNYKNNSKILISDRTPNPGDKIFTISSPMGFSKTISEGIVSGKHNNEGIKLIQISAPISHGSSGGPVLDEYGHLIGVTVGGIDEANSIGFCIPAINVKSLIEYKENYSRGLLDLFEEVDKAEKEVTPTNTAQIIEENTDKNENGTLKYLFTTSLNCGYSVEVVDTNYNEIYKCKPGETIYVIKIDVDNIYSEIHVNGYTGYILNLYLKRRN